MLDDRCCKGIPVSSMLRIEIGMGLILDCVRRCEGAPMGAQTCTYAQLPSDKYASGMTASFPLCLYKHPPSCLFDLNTCPIISSHAVSGCTCLLSVPACHDLHIGSHNVSWPHSLCPSTGNTRGGSVYCMQSKCRSVPFVL